MVAYISSIKFSNDAFLPSAELAAFSALSARPLSTFLRKGISGRFLFFRSASFRNPDLLSQGCLVCTLYHCFRLAHCSCHFAWLSRLANLPLELVEEIRDYSFYDISSFEQNATEYNISQLQVTFQHVHVRTHLTKSKMGSNRLVP